ncbi:MAG: anthranilate synthase component I family protein [Pseudomonadota bacterium]
MPLQPALELGWRTPLDALDRISDAPGALLLHGGAATGSGRFSYLSAFPAFVVAGDDRDSFERLRTQFRTSALQPGPARFQAGYAGLFSYDLGAAFEPVDALPDAIAAWPGLHLGWYEAVACFDHDARRLTVCGKGSAAQRLAAAICAPRSKTVAGFHTEGLAPEWSQARYLRAVRLAREYIRAGDVFQVNLSHPYRGAVRGERAPFAYFRALTEASPAAFSAYYRLSEDQCVVTNSPERFLRVTADGDVQTQPIKGTRPRGRTQAEDDALAADLAGSAKDRAENLMIVDLMRNDLSRVCEPGSVRTPSLFSIESYANVHHLVSRVQGRLREDQTVFELIAAAFPPGSITGAPKPRAMELIAELEEEKRGPYCGALGWIGADGAADLNVMIRTVGFARAGEGWRVEARSGGAIVIDSDPEDELAETRAKIAAIQSAFAQGARS